MINKLIINHESITKEFIEYIINKKYDPINIIGSNIRTQLGYLLDFLEYKGLNIVVDNYNYCIYYMDNSPQAVMYIRLKKTPMLISSNNNNIDNNIGIIENYKTAIFECFKHLESPF